MKDNAPMNIIAHIKSDFPTKFGIPRQSGLVDSLVSVIVFEPEYRNVDAFSGLEGYSHLWIIWKFSESVRDTFSPTVRPPRLGGNTRKGVFATRSPYRPNPIGLSSVAIEKIDLHTKDGPVIYVRGADIMDGTPIYDIKPYIAYTDSHEDASGGFALTEKEGALKVEFPDTLIERVANHLRKPLCEVLAQDVRPGYQHDDERIYKLAFADMDVHFRVADDTVYVVDVKFVER